MTPKLLTEVEQELYLSGAYEQVRVALLEALEEVENHDATVEELDCAYDEISNLHIEVERLDIIIENREKKLALIKVIACEYPADEAIVKIKAILDLFGD